MEKIINENIINNTIETLIDTDIDVIDALSSCEIKFALDIEEAKKIDHWIKIENMKNWKHMIEKDYQEIFEEANKFGCCVIKFSWELIWFIKIMAVSWNWFQLFEKWWLFVHPNYRKKWFGKVLVKEIANKYACLPVYSVTNVQAVMKINEELWHHMYKKSNLSKHLLEIIESEWELLDNDLVYGNSVFNFLTKKHD